MALTKQQKEDLDNFIEDLKKDYRYNIENFDKQAIYIAGGSLAISLTFIKDIVPLNEVICLVVYYIAIGFFSLSLLLGFLSFLISSEIINQNKEYLKRVRDEKREKGKYRRDNTTSKLNYFNAGLITFGIILIVIFTIINLNNYSNTNHKNRTKMLDKEELMRKKMNGEKDLIKSLRAEDLPDSLRALVNTDPNVNSAETTSESSSTEEQADDNKE